MAYDAQFQAFVFVLLRTAVIDALASAGVSNRIYWQLAPDDVTYPFIVFQSQDNGGQRNDFINENGWVGKITIRVHSYSPNEADNILKLATGYLLQSRSVGSYKFRAIPEHPIPYLPQDYGGNRIYTTAVIYQVEIQI